MLGELRKSGGGETHGVITVASVDVKRNGGPELPELWSRVVVHGVWAGWVWLITFVEMAPSF